MGQETQDNIHTPELDSVLMLVLPDLAATLDAIVMPQL